MTDNTQLAACPFCGGEARLWPVIMPFDADCDTITIQCSNCDATGASVLVDQDVHDASDLPSLEAEAIAAWNQRTKPAVPDVREADWWEPEPNDPFWMLEVTFGDEQGAWLRNKHSYATTRDPSKALRFPSQWTADIARRGLGGSQDGRFKPTEHTWIAALTQSPTCCEAEREATVRWLRDNPTYAHEHRLGWPECRPMTARMMADAIERGEHTAIRGADQ